jgi:nitrite reductase/ring-hydroxylating ferredoxin subunit/DMSO/TMAO reductase YedYZ heme-binding membrane subunit
VQWTPYKRRYDLVLVACVLAYFAAFFGVASIVHHGANAISPEIVLIRAAGTAAIVMLHVTLSLGPLARLDRRFLPLLYNRRHLGVITFLLSLLHAGVGIGFYHGFGRIGPLRSLLTSNVQYGSISAFPFETLGLIGLLILFVMAATSHDFWLKNLSPRVWKTIHMLVYVAWLAVVAHVALGALQSERSVVYALLLIVGVVWLGALHVLAGRREVRKDRGAAHAEEWIDAGIAEMIAEGRGRTVHVAGREPIAVFRHHGKISAVSNTCAHQGGPLGEGRIIDGCITCPWHGFTYRPEDGCAPPPFTEKLPTFAVRVENGRVLINTSPLPPGTYVEPAVIELEEAVHA